MKLDDPTSGAGGSPALEGRAFSLVRRGATVCAALGGFVLLGMALLTCFSVVSRMFINRPVPGMFELVELFTGIAVLSFFPYTHVMRGNVTAEFFTTRAPQRLNDLLDLVADLVFLAIAAFLFWRVGVGFIESLTSRDRTFVLNMPEWVFYGPAAFWLLLLLIVTLAVAAVSARKALA